ncbi:MAG: hypothetical protein ABEJ82_04105 [Haloplanus sp.]
MAEGVEYLRRRGAQRGGRGRRQPEALAARPVSPHVVRAEVDDDAVGTGDAVAPDVVLRLEVDVAAHVLPRGTDAGVFEERPLAPVDEPVPGGVALVDGGAESNPRVRRRPVPRELPVPGVREAHESLGFETVRDRYREFAQVGMEVVLHVEGDGALRVDVAFRREALCDGSGHLRRGDGREVVSRRVDSTYPLVGWLVRHASARLERRVCGSRPSPLVSDWLR